MAMKIGALVGAVLYLGTRLYGSEEEAILAKTFGPAWEEYLRRVKMPWL
jgi:protein-S-isoprenylcysteine O-methyltransferase Ste14